jgi:hypothetical protein
LLGGGEFVGWEHVVDKANRRTPGVDMSVFLDRLFLSSRLHSTARRALAGCAAAILLVTLAAGGATATTPARGASGDPSVVSEWNALTVTTLLGDTTKILPEHMLYMGFVQAAVYDAVVGVEGRYAPYRFHAPARPAGPRRRWPRWWPRTGSW